MAESKKDNNQVATMLGTSNADGSTTIPVKANASTNTLCTQDGTSGSDLSNSEIAERDQNSIPAMLAVSSTDGVTPVAIYADPATGELLIKST